MNSVITFVLTRPQWLAAVGQLLSFTSSSVFLAGLLAAVCAKAVALVGTLSKTPSPAALSDWLPGVPTWWVPESAAAFAGALVAFAAGVALQLLAKKYERLMR